MPSAEAEWRRTHNKDRGHATIQHHALFLIKRVLREKNRTHVHEYIYQSDHDCIGLRY